jgi:hypothetical protein
MSETRSEIVWYLMVEVLLFAFAALVHGGLVMPGHEHAKAAMAETIIAIILAAGLIMTFVSPAQTRIVALITQGLALAGVIIGLIMSAVGIGPRGVRDLVVHAIMAVTLVLGLIVAKRGMPT